MDHDAEEMARETLLLHREYILLFEDEIREWQLLRDRWMTLVDEWANRGNHSTVSQQAFNKQWQRVYDIVEERTDLLKIVDGDKTSRLKELSEAIKDGVVMSSEYLMEVQRQIKTDIDTELVKKHQIAERMRVAVADLAQVCSQN
jgi:hypothetical protein